MDNFIIAIVSHNRAKKLKEKTLKILNDANIENIYLFVSDEEQKKKYINEIPENNFKEIVITKTNTLIEKKTFIYKYFHKDLNIIICEDDINKFVIKDGNKTKQYNDLKKLFNDGFELCKKNNTKIFGIYPVSNGMFMKDNITTDFKFILNVCYGYISDPEDETLITKDAPHKEDYERSILYYKKFKKVIRINNISIQTCYFSAGGFSLEKTERQNKMEESAQILLNKYPEYIKNIFYRKDGTPEIKFKILKNEEYMGNYLNNLDEIKLYDIKKTKKYNQIVNELLELLKKRVIPKIEGIRKDGKYSRGKLIGDLNARTISFGIGNRRNLGYGEFKTNKERPELYEKSLEFGKLISPDGFEFTNITINHNMIAKKHIDSLNVGNSLITAIGDFKKGGGLYVYEGDKRNLYKLKNKALLANGAKYYHETEPYEGERYTFIFYISKKTK